MMDKDKDLVPKSGEKPSGEQTGSDQQLSSMVDSRHPPSDRTSPPSKSADDEGLKPEPGASKVPDASQPSAPDHVEQVVPKPAAQGSSAFTLRIDRAPAAHPNFGFSQTTADTEIDTKSDSVPEDRMAGGVSPLRRRRRSTGEDPGFVQLGPRGEVQHLDSTITFDLKEQAMEATGGAHPSFGTGRVDGALEAESVAPEDSASRAGTRFHTDGRSVAASGSKVRSRSGRLTPSRSVVFQNRVDLLMIQRDEARQARDDANRKLAELKQQFEAFQDQCLLKEQEGDGASMVSVYSAKVRLQDVEAQLDRHKADTRVLSSQVQQKDGEIGTLTTQLGQARTRIETCETEINIWKSRAERITSEAGEEKRRYDAQTAQLKDSVERKNGQVQGLEKELQGCKLEKSKEGSANRDLRAKEAEYIRRLQAYHQNAADLSQYFDMSCPPLSETLLMPEAAVSAPIQTQAPYVVTPTAPPVGSPTNPQPTSHASATWQIGTNAFSGPAVFQPMAATSAQASRTADAGASRPKIKNLPSPAKLDITKRGFTHVAFQEWRDNLRRYFMLSGYDEVLWPHMIPYYMVGFAERRVTGYLEENPDATFDSVVDFIKESVLPKRNVAASYVSMRSMTYVKGKETLREFYDKLVKTQQETRGIRDLEPGDFAAVREAFFSKLPPDYQDYIMQQMDWESMDAQQLIKFAEHHEFRFTVKDSLNPQGSNGQIFPAEGGQAFNRGSKPSYRGYRPQVSANGLSSGSRQKYPRNRRSFGKPTENGRGGRDPQANRISEERSMRSDSQSPVPKGSQRQQRTRAEERSSQAQRSRSVNSQIREGRQHTVSPDASRTTTFSGPRSQTPGTRSGACFSCGQLGHFRADCPEIKSANRGYVSEISDIEQQGLRHKLKDGSEPVARSPPTPIPVVTFEPKLNPFEFYSGAGYTETDTLTIEEDRESTVLGMPPLNADVEEVDLSELYLPDTYPVQIASVKEGPIEVDVMVEGIAVTFKLDTGANPTVIPSWLYDKLVKVKGQDFVDSRCTSSDLICKTYDGTPIPAKQCIVLEFDTGKTRALIPCMLDQETRGKSGIGSDPLLGANGFAALGFKITGPDDKVVFPNQDTEFKYDGIRRTFEKYYGMLDGPLSEHPEVNFNAKTAIQNQKERVYAIIQLLHQENARRRKFDGDPNSQMPYWEYHYWVAMLMEVPDPVAVMKDFWKRVEAKEKETGTRAKADISQPARVVQKERKFRIPEDGRDTVVHSFCPHPPGTCPTSKLFRPVPGDRACEGGQLDSREEFQRLLRKIEMMVSEVAQKFGLNVKGGNTERTAETNPPEQVRMPARCTLRSNSAPKPINADMWYPYKAPSICRVKSKIAEKVSGQERQSATEFHHDSDSKSKKKWKKRVRFSNTIDVGEVVVEDPPARVIHKECPIYVAKETQLVSQELDGKVLECAEPRRFAVLEANDAEIQTKSQEPVEETTCRHVEIAHLNSLSRSEWADNGAQWPSATPVSFCNQPLPFPAYPDSFARSQKPGSEGGARVINFQFSQNFSQVSGPDDFRKSLAYWGADSWPLQPGAVLPESEGDRSAREYEEMQLQAIQEQELDSAISDIPSTSKEVLVTEYPPPFLRPPLPPGSKPRSTIWWSVGGAAPRPTALLPGVPPIRFQGPRTPARVVAVPQKLVLAEPLVITLRPVTDSRVSEFFRTDERKVQAPPPMQREVTQGAGRSLTIPARNVRGPSPPPGRWRGLLPPTLPAGAGRSRSRRGQFQSPDQTPRKPGLKVSPRSASIQRKRKRKPKPLKKVNVLPQRTVSNEDFYLGKRDRRDRFIPGFLPASYVEKGQYRKVTLWGETHIADRIQEGQEDNADDSSRPRTKSTRPISLGRTVADFGNLLEEGLAETPPEPPKPRGKKRKFYHYYEDNKERRKVAAQTSNWVQLDYYRYGFNEELPADHLAARHAHRGTLDVSREFTLRSETLFDAKPLQVEPTLQNPLGIIRSKPTLPKGPRSQAILHPKTVWDSVDPPAVGPMTESILYTHCARHPLGTPQAEYIETGESLRRLLKRVTDMTPLRGSPQQVPIFVSLDIEGIHIPLDANRHNSAQRPPWQGCIPPDFDLENPSWTTAKKKEYIERGRSEIERFQKGQCILNTTREQWEKYPILPKYFTRLEYARCLQLHFPDGYQAILDLPHLVKNKVDPDKLIRERREDGTPGRFIPYDDPETGTPNSGLVDTRCTAKFYDELEDILLSKTLRKRGQLPIVFLVANVNEDRPRLMATLDITMTRAPAGMVKIAQDAGERVIPVIEYDDLMFASGYHMDWTPKPPEGYNRHGQPYKIQWKKAFNPSRLLAFQLYGHAFYKRVPDIYKRQRGPFYDKKRNPFKEEPSVIEFLRGCPQLEPHTSERTQRPRFLLGNKGNLGEVFNTLYLSRLPYEVLVYLEDEAVTLTYSSMAAAIQRYQVPGVVGGAPHSLSEEVLVNILLFCNSVRRFCSTSIEAMIPAGPFSAIQDAVLSRFNATAGKLIKTTAKAALKRSGLTDTEIATTEQFGPGELLSVHARSVSAHSVPESAGISGFMDTSERPTCPMLGDVEQFHLTLAHPKDGTDRRQLDDQVYMAPMLCAEKLDTEELRTEDLGDLKGLDLNDSEETSYVDVLLEAKILRYDNLLASILYVEGRKTINLVKDIILFQLVRTANISMSTERQLDVAAEADLVQNIFTQIKARKISLRQLYFHVYREWSKPAQALAFDGYYKCDCYKNEVPYPYPKAVAGPTMFEVMKDWALPREAVVGASGTYWLENVSSITAKIRMRNEKLEKELQAARAQPAASAQTSQKTPGTPAAPMVVLPEGP